MGPFCIQAPFEDHDKIIMSSINKILVKVAAAVLSHGVQAEM